MGIGSREYAVLRVKCVVAAGSLPKVSWAGYWPTSETAGRTDIKNTDPTKGHKVANEWRKRYNLITVLK
jgi:hypothetical protein